jgi:Protein of unknown function (DUF998)
MKRLPQLALFAVLGQVMLLASAWLLPLASEYRLVTDNISELVLGRYGFIQVVALVLSGLGVIGLSYAIRRQTSGRRGSSVGSVLIGVYGAGALLVAIVPTDRIDSPTDVWSQSTIGWIHSLTALLSYLCVIFGMFILTWTFARDVRWRSLVVWSSLLAGAALSLLFAQAEGPWVGLMQRLLITAISGWLIMVALRVRTIASLPEMVADARNGLKSAAG